MRPTDETLLTTWRCVAFVGHHLGADRLGEDTTNRVLRYHSVGGGFYDDIAPEDLREQLGYLTEAYEVVDLPAVLESADQKRVALTFDDGYRDFHHNVLPILREFDTPATVFVPVRAIEDPEFSHTEQFDCEYMTLPQLRDVAATDLVTVGNHTATHPRLSGLSRSRLETEIVGARQRLEELIETDVSRFCYPFNGFDDRAAGLVRETHDIGVASGGRFEGVTPETDPATVPRINGPNPLYELRWDLSDAALRVGRVGHRLLGLV